MKIFLEYLKRHNLIDDYFKPPYSVFIENKTSKRVLGIYTVAGKDELMIKQWDLIPNLSEPLPIHTTFFMSKKNILLGKMIPKGYKSIPYFENSFPWISTRPPDEKVYEMTWQQSMNDHYHQNQRRNWLWRAFTISYSITAVPHLNYHSLCGVVVDGKRIGQYWDIWLMHMLNNSEVAIELFLPSSVFASFDPFPSSLTKTLLDKLAGLHPHHT